MESILTWYIPLLTIFAQFETIAHRLFLCLLDQLNADLSLIRRLDMDEDGRVQCSFEDSRSNGNTFPVCPHVESALRRAAKFKHDELEWLVRYNIFANTFQLQEISLVTILTFCRHLFQQNFRDVLSRMMTSGYSTRSCDDTICKLSS